MNEPILLQIGISGPRGKDMKLQQWGQEAKGQGHSRPELDLEAWWGIILGPLSSAKAEVMRSGPFFCHLFCLSFDEIWHTTADWNLMIVTLLIIFKIQDGGRLSY